MPTTISVRLRETRSDDGLVSFCLALLQFYVVLALVLLSRASKSILARTRV